MCACSTSKPVDNLSYRFLSVTLPPVVRIACHRPSLLPERALNAREVVHYWGRDRAALLICEQRRKAAVQAIVGKRRF
ncbi:hypothetical protein BVtw_00570 [Bartonella vinsonii subsp. berkhoffii str. Tweed]|uniref:Uncharacterized protein n=1 Tax=Bartonella vinsonii subsp. berkhoffii str. Tweed TaxID=1094502 RepID=N6VWN4_BARVB|nr:hypothetical protein BVtw_15370 [Bartonella vinsonii subsp. berkhoffii str. Tweed]ENN94032.1 hypothetical protein BVtw_14380 [Bartonella vinsonii subsp. berkhoffii str. Tweed]ENN94063.1 hypothetical protein BVtw_14140 [Bartonella vinsonii subsp. berkhoffii str. Tweed]ENN94801.1 hypothetical protein BVtw_08260 [Bartonella vinsonii subsp. berkhoffii str. Tweed]ENN95517.1 hypothetical protein BVtw_00570 [Bartonella vinsonii subsp. berkhoffii str. Tweed]